MYTPVITYTGPDGVSILSDIVSQCNVRERFNSDEETWPPEQPKIFTPLLLIHHQGQHSMKQATAVAHLIQTGDIDKVTSLGSNQSTPKHHPKLDSHEPLQEVLDGSTVTKELTEILAPLEQSEDPQFILIEGAPGIGKSVLLKEIAYRWGNKQLLKMFKLVLLVCLRDPTVQQASLIKDLLQLFCYREDTRATQIATACRDHFVQNGGKDLVFLFDGFDEFPEALKKNSLIADIIKRKVLHNCALVVSSRPHATVHLRDQASIRVDILGFTETERKRFIQQALKERPQDIMELTQYLEHHFAISSLCVVPFNMVVLLFLYKQGISLPKNSTELYNHFICLTICRHLAKYGHSLNEITNLSNLPDPYNKIIQQLSKLSLEALNNNKLVFTFDEIKMACPDILTIPGAINGFGLLQAIQHFGLTGKTMTFNFLHLSIQEFLAAYHISCLLPNDKLKVLKEKFWSVTHSNMFAIYVALTKGQQPSFRQFLEPSLGKRIKGYFKGEGVPISDQFLDTYLKCLHLFRCFFEAGNKEICTTIESASMFDSSIIDLGGNVLLPSDIECVAFFLAYSSHKEWKNLNFWGCYLQDLGVHILNYGLTNSNVTITTLWLNNNDFTESSSSAISKITIHCRVKELWINGNRYVGEDESLYSIISDSSSMLEELHMDNINLSSSGAIKLFTALSKGKKLKVLWIGHNDVTDEACDAIMIAIKNNTSLTKLKMYNNPISGECAQLIVQALLHNNTLEYLGLNYGYPQDVKERIKLLAEEVNNKRENCGCQTNLQLNFSNW